MPGDKSADSYLRSKDGVRQSWSAGDWGRLAKNVRSHGWRSRSATWMCRKERFLASRPQSPATPKQAVTGGKAQVREVQKREKGTDSRYGQKSGHREEQPAPLVPTGRFEVLQAGHHGQAHHHGPQNLGLYRPAIARTNERGGIKERRLAGTRGHRCCAITGSGAGQSGSPG